MEKGDGDGVTGPEVLRKGVNPKCRSEGRPLERGEELLYWRTAGWRGFWCSGTVAAARVGGGEE